MVVGEITVFQNYNSFRSHIIYDTQYKWEYTLAVTQGKCKYRSDTHRTCKEETFVKDMGMPPVKVLLLRRLFQRAK